MSKKRYITTKIVEAELIGDGYKVVNNNGHTTWCPKEIFERKSIEMPSTHITITQEMVDDFISYVNCQTMDNKTTVVIATLRNGFSLVESSSCVDPLNYDMEIGKEVCMQKIKDKVWFLLGFLLQSAQSGFQIGVKQK